MTILADMAIGVLLVIAGVKMIVSSCYFVNKKSQQHHRHDQHHQQLDGGSGIGAAEPIVTPCTEISHIQGDTPSVRLFKGEKVLVVATSRRLTSMLKVIAGSSSATTVILLCSRSFSHIEESCRGRPGEAQIRGIMSPMGTFVKTILRSIIRNEQGCVAEALKKEAAKLAEQHAIGCRAILRSIETGKDARGYWPAVVVDPILLKRTSLLKANLEVERDSQRRQQPRPCPRINTAATNNNNTSLVVRNYSAPTINAAALSSPFSRGTSFFGSSSSLSSSLVGGGNADRQASTFSRKQILASKASDLHLRRLSAAPRAALVVESSAASRCGTSLSGAGAMVGRKLTVSRRKTRILSKGTVSTPFALS